MLTTNMLVLLIASFCQISNPAILEDDKLYCLEYITNCSVGLNGIIDEKKVEQCKREFNPNAKKGEWF